MKVGGAVGGAAKKFLRSFTEKEKGLLQLSGDWGGGESWGAGSGAKSREQGGAKCGNDTLDRRVAERFRMSEARLAAQGVGQEFSGDEHGPRFGSPSH